MSRLLSRAFTEHMQYPEWEARRHQRQNEICRMSVQIASLQSELRAAHQARLLRLAAGKMSELAQQASDTLRLQSSCGDHHVQLMAQDVS